jgi:hypothetical protein
LIKVASFDEAEPTTDVFGQWWSAEDSDTIVDLADDDVKPKSEDSLDVEWDYNAFYH